MNTKNLKKKIVQLILPQSTLDRIEENREKKQLNEWNQLGNPFPPPHIVKQITIREYQQKYACNVLVETGTFMGDMVEAQKKRFKKIISIELAVSLFNKAKKRFINDSNIVIMQGDSGKVLPEIMKTLDEPAVFWLDGHYSAGETAKGDTECPIFEELTAILGNTGNDHILLIDDARLFIGQGDYPATEELTAFIKQKNPAYQLEVKNDIIRYVVSK